MRKTRFYWLPALLSLALFGGAMWVLHRDLKEFHFADVVAEFKALPNTAILLACLATAAGYAVLTGYDVLALRYIGQKLRYSQVALASFVSYVFSHNIGLSLITGGSIRYRIYSAAGLSALEIATVTLLCGLTFALGAVAISGVALLLEPSTVFSVMHLPPAVSRGAGVLCLAAVIAYVVITGLRTAPIQYRGFSVSPPPLSLTFKQIILATGDIMLAATVLYLLLPAQSGVSFIGFLGIYVLAMVAGIVSHVPGGLGVFESLILLMIPMAPADALLASVLAYRVIYYLVPLGVAALLLGGFEFAQHSGRLQQGTAAVGAKFAAFAPQIIGMTVLFGGAVLLFSGASPAVDERLALLRRALLPLPLVEASHLLASLSGLGLVLLARGLFRRLDGAYYLTAFLLASGIIFSLLKGFDYEEALILAIILGVLSLGRAAFYRKASILDQQFTVGWIATIAVIVAGSIWLGLFSFKHTEYSDQLWWRFAFYEDAPRFLRASLAVVTGAVAWAVLIALRPASPAPEPPTSDELARVKEIIARTGGADANLALLGDKRLLFSDSGNSFIMFGLQGRSWISLGDPVGPAEECAELAWRFRELCHHYAGRPVFYQVNEASLPLYLDLGLSLLKLGEEAQVPLADFSLESSGRRDLRQAHRRAQRDGMLFEIVEPAQVAALLPELKAVSDAWLSSKNTREKGFSVGVFSPGYIANFPCALVRVGDRIVAFANLWVGGEGGELSFDLMRYLDEAPKGLMDFLITELMLWGRQAGYHSFNLGMAPLSGLEQHSLAPLWHQLGTFVFRHGEHFYNFEGLRSYKEKFAPVWRPKYLASPGGFATARALLDVTALISGGIKGIVTK